MVRDHGIRPSLHPTGQGILGTHTDRHEIRVTRRLLGDGVRVFPPLNSCGQVTHDGAGWVGNFGADWPAPPSGMGRFLPRGSIMANTTKLPVEKVLEKIRSSDSSRSKNARREEEMAALDEEIRRMRAQRLRLEADRRKQK